MLFQEITVEEFAEIRAREAYTDGEKAGREEGEKAGFARGLEQAAQEKREIVKTGVSGKNKKLCNKIKKGLTNLFFCCSMNTSFDLVI